MNKLKEILVAMDPKNADRLDSVTENSRLVTDLGLSSVGMLYMVIAIEESFGIEFDNDKPFETVGQVIDYIGERA